MLELIQGLKFFENNGFSLAEYYVCKNKKQLLSSFKKMNPPVVMKISSSEHSHKTEIGGVITGIKTKDELLNKYEELSEISDNIILQNQISGVEVIIGVHNDPVFNQVLMFGVGGIFVELFKDVSFRKCPINLGDAGQMINEIKSSELLKGYRGRKVNRRKLKKLLVRISELAVEETIDSLDLNPVILTKKDYFIVDVRLSQ